jgi:hypothetical protein
MNRIIGWKTAGAVLTGCVLALGTATGFGAASPSEGTARMDGAAATAERYQLYGYAMETWVTEGWTYLGAYDSAEAAEAVGKAACRSKEEERPFQKYRVMKSAGVKLPLPVVASGTPPIAVYRLSPDADGDRFRLVGRFRTVHEAEEAADKVLAAPFEGRFMVVYYFGPKPAEPGLQTGRPESDRGAAADRLENGLADVDPAGAADSKEGTAARAEATPATERYHAYSLGSTRRGVSWFYLGSYADADAADAAGKAGTNRGGYADGKYRVVKGVGLELPPADKRCTFVLTRLSKQAAPEVKFRTLAEAASAAERIAAAGDRFEVVYDEFE